MAAEIKSLSKLYGQWSQSLKTCLKSRRNLPLTISVLAELFLTSHNKEIHCKYRRHPKTETFKNCRFRISNSICRRRRRRLSKRSKKLSICLSSSFGWWVGGRLEQLFSNLFYGRCPIFAHLRLWNYNQRKPNFFPISTFDVRRQPSNGFENVWGWTSYCG